MLGGSVSGIRFERRREAVSSVDEAVALLDRLLPRRLPVENSAGTPEPDRGDGRGLSGFAGEVIQSGTLGIPVDAAGFDLDCDEFVTEISFDGESLGTRLWPPFFWNVPERFRGRRVACRIVRRTSIGPIFGELGSGEAARPAWTRNRIPGGFPLRHPVVEPRFRRV